jgi:peptide/nickel transport system permease protein
MGDILSIIAKRLGLGLITLLVISIIIFFAVELLPGDIAQAVLGQGATEDNLAALRAELGLDRAAPLRYLEWLGNALTGDFGNSLVSKTPVAEAIGTRFGNTLFLAVYAAVIAVPVAIFLGVLVALFRNSVFDRVANVVTLTSISSPEFFLGYILILFLAVKGGMFPAIAKIDDDMDLIDKLNRTFLPALTMVLVVVAHMMRMTRASIINLLASPYVEMARLKGVPAWKVIVHQRGRAEPGLPDNGGGAGRGGVRLPGHRPIAGRCRHQARFSGGTGLLSDLCGDLHFVKPGCGRGVDSDQSAFTSSEVRAES